MSNNNEIFMPENKSNKASIIVAIVAICLILGGVYLLNQSFSSPAKKETPTQTASNTPSTTKDTDTPKTTTDNTSTSTVDSTPDTTLDATLTPSPTTTPSTTTPPAAPTTTPTAPTLEKNQLIAKVLSIDSGLTKFEIQSCGIPDAKVCKSPLKFNLSGVKASVDKIYLVTGSITETGTALALENITIKEYTTT